MIESKTIFDAFIRLSGVWMVLYSLWNFATAFTINMGFYSGIKDLSKFKGAYYMTGALALAFGLALLVGANVISACCYRGKHKPSGAKSESSRGND